MTKLADDDNWKYAFYVINRQQEFVYGFDDPAEARLYADDHNRRRHRSDYKVVPLAEAMTFSTGLTPNYMDAWSDNWKEPA